MAIWLAALFLLVMNIASFTVWGMDKARARRRAWRIRERHMLALAALGGMGGALLGQYHFRHKTRKRRFAAALYLIALAEAAGVGWLIGYF